LVELRIEPLKKISSLLKSGAEAPQSKRSATDFEHPGDAKRLECGVFTAAFVCWIVRSPRWRANLNRLNRQVCSYARTSGLTIQIPSKQHLGD